MGKKEKRENAGEVTRWEPFGELRPWARGFGTGLERLFDRFLEEMAGEPRVLSMFMAPAIDLSEDDSSYTLTAELPGVEKEAVAVELTEGVLTIRGEKKTEREEKTERKRYSERSFGAFSRSIPLPRDAQGDPAHVDASFKDGVLTVKIPRSEEAKPAVIAVK